MQFTHTAKPVPVHAAVILDVTNIPFPEGTGADSPQLTLRLSDGRNYEANSSMTSRYTPVVGDYLVTQEDGYEYLNPKDVFERKYSAAPATDPIESEIQAKGLTAPRVTPARIADVISSELTFTVGNAGRALNVPVSEAADLLTICVITLKNGFTVTGESACASPENFDADLGRKIARENAVNKIWALEGYLLKEALYVESVIGK